MTHHDAFPLITLFTRDSARVMRLNGKIRQDASCVMLRASPQKHVTTRHPIRRAHSPGGATGIVSSELPLGMARSPSTSFRRLRFCVPAATGEGPHRHKPPVVVVRSLADMAGRLA
jgi:hypothetical protein